MDDRPGNLYYRDYLQLDKLLHAQVPESGKYGSVAHDETLFIITHQTYELWFKQILYELASILAMFSKVPINSKQLGTITSRLGRIVSIQKVINQQIGILETMMPQDFLEFRDYLTPASGFQSVQFREIELRLGLESHLKPGFLGRFRQTDRVYLEGVADEASLFEMLDAWLGRMPFLNSDDFDFWSTYQQAVDKMLNADAETIRNNPSLNDDEKRLQYIGLETTRKNFDCLFDDQAYKALAQEGRFHLSKAATLSALFINLYRECQFAD